MNPIAGLQDVILAARLFAFLLVVLFPMLYSRCWRRNHALFQLPTELRQIHPDVPGDTIARLVAPVGRAWPERVLFEDHDLAALLELKERRVPGRIGAGHHDAV